MSELEYTSKVCTSCGEEKHVTEFYKSKRYRDGFQSWCKECKDAKSGEWRIANRAKASEHERRARYKRVYGITVEQYNQQLEKQNHRCAICDKHEDDEKRKFAIDHDHHTGEIRGLLCTYCNHRAVGRHRDSALLRKIADYLDQGTGWFVPKKKRPIKRKPKRV